MKEGTPKPGVSPGETARLPNPCDPRGRFTPATEIGQVLTTLDTAHRDIRPAVPDRGEAGYALTELLMVSALLVIVLGAILALGETTQRITPSDTERAHVIREAQVGLHAMTRQLRQAADMEVPPHEAPTAATIDATMRDGARYSFECDEPHPTQAGYNRCVRFPVDAAGVKQTGQGRVLIDRVLNGPAGTGATHPIFRYETNVAGIVTYLHVEIHVPAKGDRPDGHDYDVVLEDGVYMRNLDA
jgi:Tfp pilus assembly protein PilX